MFKYMTVFAEHSTPFPLMYTLCYHYLYIMSAKVFGVTFLFTDTMLEHLDKNLRDLSKNSDSVISKCQALDHTLCPKLEDGRKSNRSLCCMVKKKWGICVQSIPSCLRKMATQRSKWWGSIACTKPGPERKVNQCYFIHWNNNACTP